jgi:NAD(P)-dependent dehydrogenase (short-subunit alcohol dehydrogenase family)
MLTQDQPTSAEEPMDDTHTARGMRVLVVGASSGIGQELARQLVGHGALVVGAARRVDRIATVEGVKAVACDVRDAKACGAAVEAASDHLGGIDAVVYAAGLSRITPLDRSCIDDWQALFETNLFGAAMVTKAALPQLLAPGSQGRAMYLTSDSSDTAFPGLVAYSASKAALARFCEGLAEEFPALRVSEVFVGPTSHTGIADCFDPAEFAEWATRWFEGSYIRYGLQHPSDAAKVILAALVSHSPPARVMAARPI